MGDGDFFNPFEWFCSVGNIVDRVKNFRAVIPRTASITHPDNNIFEDYEAILVFECFARNHL